MPRIQVTCDHCDTAFDDLGIMDLSSSFFGCAFCAEEMCPECEYDSDRGLHEECVSKMDEEEAEEAEWPETSTEGDL